MFKFIYGALLIGLLLVARGLSSYASIEDGNTEVVIAFSHAAQNVGAIDIYIDHNLVIEDFSSTNANATIQVTPGNHLVDVVPDWGTIVLIKTTEMAFEAGHTYQFVLIALHGESSAQLLVLDERPALTSSDNPDNLYLPQVIHELPLDAYVNNTLMFDLGDYRVFSTPDGLVEIRMMFEPARVAPSERNALWQALLDVYCLGRCSPGFPADSYNELPTNELQTS